MGIIPGNFSAAFQRYKIRQNGVWQEEPVMSIKVNPASFTEVGTFDIVYPNPKGALNNYVRESDIFEIWIADPELSTMYQLMVGVVNNIDKKNKHLLNISGRSLTGLLFNRVVADAWENKAIDFIICDETFGILANYFPTLTSFNAFSLDWDDFANWNVDRWGAQPAWASIDASILKLTGDSGSDRTIVGQDEYNYEFISFKARVTANQDDIYFGLKNSSGTNYIRFNLPATGTIACQASNGTPQTSTVSGVYTTTNYNYYRIEWSSDEIRFFVNGTLEASFVANIPAGNLSPFFSLDTTTNELWIDYVKVIETNDILPAYKSVNRSGYDVVEDLCKIAGQNDIFVFWIDVNYDLNALEAQTVSTAIQLGQNSSVYPNNIQSIDSITKGDEVKNTIIVYGGEQLTNVSILDPAVDRFIATNNVTTSWALGYKAKKPLLQVEVNGTPVTENTDFTVNYGINSTIVKFVNPLSTNDTLDLWYDYFTPVRGFADDTDSIVYNNRGIKDFTYTDTNIQSTDVANLTAQGLLKLKSDPRLNIACIIPIKPQIQVGYTVSVDAPNMGITQTQYEVMKVEHNIPASKTTLQLISSEITTVPETFKAIYKELQDLKANQINTDAPVLKSTEITEEITVGNDNAEMQQQVIYICDSFILGHSRNGQLGVGTILDDFESDVLTNWTSGDFVVGTSTALHQTGAQSMSLSYAGTGSMSVTGTTNFGDISTYTGASSGAPSKGCAGFWAYLSSSSQLTAVALELGSSSTAIATQIGSICDSNLGNTQISGWNYFVFPLTSATITGTPNWAATDYARITFNLASGSVLYLDYLTISSQSTIALNGLGRRDMTVGVTGV